MLLIRRQVPSTAGGGGLLGPQEERLAAEGLCLLQHEQTASPAGGTRRSTAAPGFGTNTFIAGGTGGAAHQAKSGLLSSLESSHRQFSSSSESPRNLGGTMSMTSLRSAAGLLCSGLARRSGRCFRMP